MKRYWKPSCGIKYNRRSSYCINHYRKPNNTFSFCIFLFVLFVWTDGSGPTTMPYSDCDGASIP